MPPRRVAQRKKQKVPQEETAVVESSSSGLTGSTGGAPPAPIGGPQETKALQGAIPLGQMAKPDEALLQQPQPQHQHQPLKVLDRVQLIFVCGNSATGKSTHGKKLARALRAVLLDSNTVTECLVNAGAKELGFDPSGYDRRSQDFKKIFREPVYETLYEVARENLEIGLPVVVVAPFTIERRDQNFLSVVSERFPNAEVAVHYVACGDHGDEDANERKQRLRERGTPQDRSKLRHWSEYTATAQDPEGKPPFHHVYVNTTGPERPVSAFVPQAPLPVAASPVAPPAVPMPVPPEATCSPAPAGTGTKEEKKDKPTATPSTAKSIANKQASTAKIGRGEDRQYSSEKREDSSATAAKERAGSRASKEESKPSRTTPLPPGPTATTDERSANRKGKGRQNLCLPPPPLGKLTVRNFKRSQLILSNLQQPRLVLLMWNVDSLVPKEYTSLGFRRRDTKRMYQDLRGTAERLYHDTIWGYPYRGVAVYSKGSLADREAGMLLRQVESMRAKTVAFGDNLSPEESIDKGGHDLPKGQVEFRTMKKLVDGVVEEGREYRAPAVLLFVTADPMKYSTFLTYCCRRNVAVSCVHAYRPNTYELDVLRCKIMGCCLHVKNVEKTGNDYEVLVDGEPRPPPEALAAAGASAAATVAPTPATPPATSASTPALVGAAPKGPRKLPPAKPLGKSTPSVSSRVGTPGLLDAVQPGPWRGFRSKTCASVTAKRGELVEHRRSRTNAPPTPAPASAVSSAPVSPPASSAPPAPASSAPIPELPPARTVQQILNDSVALGAPSPASSSPNSALVKELLSVVRQSNEEEIDTVGSTVCANCRVESVREVASLMAALVNGVGGKSTRKGNILLQCVIDKCQCGFEEPSNSDSFVRKKKYTLLLGELFTRLLLQENVIGWALHWLTREPGDNELEILCSLLFLIGPHLTAKTLKGKNWMACLDFLRTGVQTANSSSLKSEAQKCLTLCEGGWKSAPKEEAVAEQKAEDEAAAKKKAEDEAAAKKKAAEEAAAKKKAEEEAAAKKKAAEEAAAKKKAAEEAAAKRAPKPPAIAVGHIPTSLAKDDISSWLAAGRCMPRRSDLTTKINNQSYSAQGCFQHVLSLDSSNAGALFELGRMAADLDTKKKCFLKALEHDLSGAEVVLLWTCLGDCLRSRKENAFTHPKTGEQISLTMCFREGLERAERLGSAGLQSLLVPGYKLLLKDHPDWGLKTRDGPALCNGFFSCYWAHLGNSISSTKLSATVSVNGKRYTKPQCFARSLSYSNNKNPAAWCGMAEFAATPELIPSGVRPTLPERGADGRILSLRQCFLCDSFTSMVSDDSLWCHCRECCLLDAKVLFEMVAAMGDEENEDEMICGCPQEYSAALKVMNDNPKAWWNAGMVLLRLQFLGVNKTVVLKNRRYNASQCFEEAMLRTPNGVQDPLFPVAIAFATPVETVVEQVYRPGTDERSAFEWYAEALNIAPNHSGIWGQVIDLTIKVMQEAMAMALPTPSICITVKNKKYFAATNDCYERFFENYVNGAVTVIDEFRWDPMYREATSHNGNIALEVRREYAEMWWGLGINLSQRIRHNVRADPFSVTIKGKKYNAQRCLERALTEVARVPDSEMMRKQIWSLLGEVMAKKKEPNAVATIGGQPHTAVDVMKVAYAEVPGGDRRQRSLCAWDLGQALFEEDPCGSVQLGGRSCTVQELIEEYLAIQMISGEGWIHLGLCLDAQSRKKNSEGVVANPNPTARVRGQVYSAQQCLQEGLKPENRCPGCNCGEQWEYRAWLTLGKLAAKKNNPPIQVDRKTRLERDCYIEALSLDPRGYESWRRLGLTLSKAGGSAAVVNGIAVTPEECFNKFLEMKPKA